MTTRSRTIETKSADGTPNGSVVLLWHADAGEPIGQVYMTTILPGQSKGPHLHRIRAGRFTCVRGTVKIVTRDADGGYRTHLSGPDHGFATVRVPVGTPAAMYNVGDEEALVLNMPNPGWRAEEPDEWPVHGWEYGK